jgi:hypothetical protein
MHNLKDLCEFLQEAKQKAQQDRLNHIKPQQREPSYILMVDLRKAFDSVNRAHLIDKLNKIGIPNYLVRLVAHLLSDTKFTTT